METRLRTWVRALTWRACAFVLTILIALFITDDIKKALEIGVLDSAIKLVTHYIHDRIWFKVKWGERPESCATFQETIKEGAAINKRIKNAEAKAEALSENEAKAQGEFHPDETNIHDQDAKDDEMRQGENSVTAI